MGPIPTSLAAAIVFAGALCCASGVAAAAPRLSEGYALYSNQALFEATADWQQLPPSARRELLMELKARGAAVPRARTERRYGYRVRRADGRVVTVERRETVTVDTSAVRQSPNRSADGFGAGFERRNSETIVRPASAPLGPGFLPDIVP